MKFRKIAILAAVIFLTIGCVYSEEKVVADKIPDDYVFIDAAVAEHFHPFKRALVCWPDARQIAESRTKVNKEAAEEATDLTMEWLVRVLRPEWIPEQTAIDFCPMSAYVQKCDAIYFRYKIKNYGFQVVSTYWSINVIIKDLGSSHPPENLEVDTAKQYVSTILDKFMQKSEQIKKTSMAKVTKTSNGVKGTFDTKLDCWYNLMGWWTDGNTVMLSTTKVDEGRPHIPGRKEVWFSDAPAAGIWQPLKKIESLDDLLPRVVHTLIAWPPPNELKKMHVLDRNILGVNFRYKTAENWINMVLSQPWRPPKDAETVIIKDEANCYDTIRRKWRKENYEIQMGQVFSTFTLKISRTDKDSFGDSQAERIENIKKLAAEIFSNTGNSWDKQGNIIKIDISGLINKSFNPDKIKSITLNNNKVIYYIGEPVEILRTWQENGNTYGTSRDVPWDEMISWFNDGNIVCFYFLKNEGCSPVSIVFESDLNSRLFEISDVRLAIKIACEKADNLKLEYDNKTIKTKHKKGLWNVIFNPGENTETTVILDAVTGNVIDVVKKSIGQAKD